MLTLIDPNSKKIEFKNSKELKEFLSTQNPGTVKKYKNQIKKIKPELIIDGLGSSLRIYTSKGKK
jgi:hypothetical protein